MLCCSHNYFEILCAVACWHFAKFGCSYTKKQPYLTARMPGAYGSFVVKKTGFSTFMRTMRSSHLGYMYSTLSIKYSSFFCFLNNRFVEFILDSKSLMASGVCRSSASLNTGSRFWLRAILLQNVVSPEPRGAASKHFLNYGDPSRASIRHCGYTCFWKVWGLKFLEGPGAYICLLSSKNFLTSWRVSLPCLNV